MQRKALYGLLFAGLLIAPWVGVYPVFVMKVLCFALFAAAFNLLIGYTGLLSFGHAMFLATAGYITGFTIESLGLPPGPWLRRCWDSSSAFLRSGDRASTSPWSRSRSRK